VLALVVLPFIQVALLMGFASVWRWASARRSPETGGLKPTSTQKPQKPLSAKWLLLLSAIAILTHPTLDWLNNYGMRWLMPFRGTWFYGDSVFIMDPWLWLILGAGFLAQRRPTAPLVVAFIAVVVLLAYIVARRSPAYVAIVAIVAVVLLIALVWRPSRSLATPALVVAAVYIVARLTIHYVVADRVRVETRATKLMVAPHPINPLRWDVVAQIGDQYRYGRWVNGTLTLAAERIPLPKPSAEWDAARRHPSVRGFITWARFPWYEIERDNGETRVLLHDARYLVRAGRRGFGGAEVVIP
jgi:inner membrane protein